MEISQNPNCPLCLKPFERLEQEGMVAFRCERDGIWINAKDPIFGKWHGVAKDPKMKQYIRCQHCFADMRFFGRSDGYMKTVCPKCGYGIEVDDETNTDAITPDQIIHEEE